jgi:hypothetical protein
MWWTEFRDEMKVARIAAPVGSVKDKVLQRAVGIVEDALKDHGDESAGHSPSWHPYS